MPEITEKIQSLVEPLLEDTDIFVVSIRIKPTNNIKLFLDSDSGMSIEKCIKINRKLYHTIEELEMFPGGDFSLEVSSPGVDEPLLNMRQYQKNVSRKVAVTPQDESEDIVGKLIDVKEDHIVLEMTVGKKKEIVVKEIPFSDIKKTVVQIIF